MLKKIKNLGLMLAVVVMAAFAFSPAQAQSVDPPPTGTCCPTTSGAFCVVGDVVITNAYYKSEGDCPTPPGGGGPIIG